MSDASPHKTTYFFYIGAFLYCPYNLEQFTVSSGRDAVFLFNGAYTAKNMVKSERMCYYIYIKLLE